MLDTLAYLRGRRIWLIRDFVVWGSLSAHQFSFLLTMTDQAQKRIMFLTVPLGGEMQKINFSDLVDFRGNHLPEKLVNPKVIPLQKTTVGAVVVGREDSETFSIAKLSSGESNALCDLIVIEVG
jgi:hypothetical protein